MEGCSGPVQCRNGCGFYAGSGTEGLCSVCYKDAIKKKQQPPTVSDRSYLPLFLTIFEMNLKGRWTTVFNTVFRVTQLIDYSFFQGMPASLAPSEPRSSGASSASVASLSIATSSGIPEATGQSGKPDCLETASPTVILPSAIQTDKVTPSHHIKDQIE